MRVAAIGVASAANRDEVRVPIFLGRSSPASASQRAFVGRAVVWQQFSDTTNDDVSLVGFHGAGIRAKSSRPQRWRCEYVGKRSLAEHFRAFRALYTTKWRCGGASCESPFVAINHVNEAQ